MGKYTIRTTAGNLEETAQANFMCIYIYEYIRAIKMRGTRHPTLFNLASDALYKKHIDMKQALLFCANSKHDPDRELALHSQLASLILESNNDRAIEIYLEYQPLPF